MATEVQTATPQRLRKMLLDGAVRFASQAQDLHEKNKEIEAYESLDRCSQIIGELLSGIQGEDELANRMKGVYVFLLTQISSLQQEWIPEGMKNLLEVLEMERETWRLVCEKHPDRLVPEQSATDLSSNDAHHILVDGQQPESSSPGFELDA